MLVSRVSAAYRHAIVLCLAVLVAGCAGQPSRTLIASSIAQTPASAIAAEHEIFIATTRAPAEDPRVVFAGGRGPATSFARVDVSVPAAHEVSEIELAPNPETADPARYFTATRLGLYRDEAAFGGALRKSLADNDGRALVFIHGYNTSFDHAVYRVTQIVHDSGYSGTPVLFSWPSAGRTIDYVYDSNSAAAARDSLERTLRLVARSGAKNIDIVAHSMGTWLTMEALRQLAITGDRGLGGRLGDVVLASPDIDVDVFKTQMRRYGVPDKPFFVLTARNDRALGISSIIAGRRPRVGDYADAQDLAGYGVIVVDLTEVSAGGDRLNHTKFADNPLLVRLLGERLSDADSLGESQDAITRRIESLAGGVGQTLGSAAELVITTPFEVLNIAVGGG